MNGINIKPWWLDAVVYELYVDRFAGNFKNLISKLDYLKYLGINTLWILPHYPSPMVDNGYDILDYNSVREGLGNLDDFEEFIKKAHQKKIRVITDLVLNHTSDKHPWFIESRSSKGNSKRDWYIWSDTSIKYSQAFVHFSDIKKTNWIYNKVTKDFYYATFYPQQPDLNWDNPAVYEAMYKVIEFWLSKGVDGFRLDAVSRLIKRDGTNCFALPETHQIIKRLRKDISEKYPEAVLMAESGGWPDEAKTFFGDQDECQLVINFHLAVNLLSAIPNQDSLGVQSAWKDSSGICNMCRWGLFLTNHDTVDLFFLNDDKKKKFLSEVDPFIKKYGLNNLLSFPARLSEICMGNKDKILWAHEQLFNLQGVQLLYYGNEIGMPNATLPDPPSDFREYVRGNFDWGEAERQIEDPNSLLNGVRGIIENSKKKV
jgi:maltose alpha-D-glucosyltransferase/alpha-amylase